MTTPTSNGPHPSCPTILSHRVQHRGKDHLATIDDASPAALDDTTILSCLSELALAVVRQARLDAAHRCDDRCFEHAYRNGPLTTRRRRNCTADSRSARMFLRDLDSGKLPPWMKAVVVAASDSVAHPALEPYAPRIDAAPHRASDHTAASARYAD